MICRDHNNRVAMDCIRSTGFFFCVCYGHFITLVCCSISNLHRHFILSLCDFLGLHSIAFLFCHLRQILNRDLVIHQCLHNTRTFKLFDCIFCFYYRNRAGIAHCIYCDHLFSSLSAKFFIILIKIPYTIGNS